MIAAIRRYILVIIWLVFAACFSKLAAYHYDAMHSSIPDFVVTKRMQAPGIRIEVGIAGMDIDKPLQDFAGQFNEYIHNQNKGSQESNWISFLGYIGAALTAVFSAVVEFRQGRKEQKNKGDDSDHNDGRRYFVPPPWE